MPILKTQIDEKTKALFSREAKLQGLKESEFLRAIIAIVIDIENQSKQKPILEPMETSTELVKLTIRLRANLINALEKEATKKGVVKSRYIAQLVQSHLVTLPVLSDYEIDVLRESNRELGAIGRNLNQVARALNEKFHETHRIKLDLLKQIQAQITLNRQAVIDLVSATKKGWSVNDE